MFVCFCLFVCLFFVCLFVCLFCLFVFFCFFFVFLFLLLLLFVCLFFQNVQKWDLHLHSNTFTRYFGITWVNRIRTVLTFFRFSLSEKKRSYTNTAGVTFSYCNYSFVSCPICTKLWLYIYMTWGNTSVALI